MIKGRAATNTRHFGWRQLLAGVLLLLALPALAVAGLWGYAGWRNQQAGAGDLACGLSASLVFGSSDVEAHCRFTAPAGTAQAQPIDMVILVDVSGSMQSSLPAIGEAIRSLSRHLLDGGEGRVQIAVVRFDEPAVIDVRWTTDFGVVDSGLTALKLMKGNNDTREAFVRLRELMDSARPNSRKLAVFFTDGQLDVEPNVMTWAEMEAAARDLREGRNHLRFYALGLPGSLDGNMERITGTTANLLRSTGVGDFARQLHEVAYQELPVFASGAEFNVPVHGAAFELRSGPAEWSIGAQGSLTQKDITLLAGANWARMPLKTTSIGLWSLGDDKARLTWRRPDGTVGEAVCAAVPMLLIVPWWLALLGLLPALAYLAWGVERLLRSVPPPMTFPLPQLPPSPSIDVLPLAPMTRPPAGQPPVASLIIGLGGEGGTALSGLALDVKHRLREASGRISLLHLDVDASDTAVADVRRLTAPPAATDLTQIVSAAGQAWFDAERYRHSARSQLDLSKGADGDRMLARLALFRWLEADLCDQLNAALTDIARAAGKQPPQVLLLASAGGGFGGGTIIDFARLLRRLDRLRQARSGGPAAEITLLLLIGGTGKAQNNEMALLEELQHAQRNGLYPSPTVYGSENPLSAAVDAEAPANWLIAVKGNNGSDLIEPAAALYDAELREALVRSLPDTALAPTELTARSLLVLPTLIRDLVADELTLRLIADLLPGMSPAPEGGYRIPPLPPETAQAMLDRWAERDATASLWRALLNVAADGGAGTQYLALEMAPYGSPGPDWFLSAFSVSVSAMLASDEAQGWHISAALMALRLFAERLHGPMARDLPDHAPLLTRIADEADQLCANLEVWISKLLQGCSTHAAHVAQLHDLKNLCDVPGSRTVLDSCSDRQGIERHCSRLFDEALGGKPAARFIAFAAEYDDGSLTLTLRSGLTASARALTPETAIAQLRQGLRALSETLPIARIDSALADLPDGEWRRRLQALAPSQSAAGEALLSVPVASERARASFIDTMVEAVIEPAGVIHRQVVESGDTTIIRRLQWGMTQVQPHRQAARQQHLPVAQLAAISGAAMRRHLEMKLEVALPPLPPELCLALSQPESFRQFADAYRAGQIVQARAADGTQQWFLTPDGPYLTDQSPCSLAAAAATFPGLGRIPSAATCAPPSPGDFSLVDRWVRGQADDSNMDDVLSLAAMRMVLQ